MRGEQFPSVPTDGEDTGADDSHVRLITVKETQARLANVTARTLRNLVKRGEIERVSIGRRVGYVESTVDAYIWRLREKARVST